MPPKLEEMGLVLEEIWSGLQERYSTDRNHKIIFYSITYVLLLLLLLLIALLPHILPNIATNNVTITCFRIKYFFQIIFLSATYRNFWVELFGHHWLYITSISHQVLYDIVTGYV